MQVNFFNYSFLSFQAFVKACLAATLFIPAALLGQVTVYSEAFNNGCLDNCPAAGFNGWTVQNNVGGVNGGDPNIWYISCAEEGIAPPGCGSTCVGDASLHIGSGAGGGGDMGASFNETGATNATFRRVVSPTINLTGFSTNTLAFDFIAFGSAACSDDRAQLHLSTDNGATWPVGFQYCLESVCCGACNGYSQGQWTTYTLALPAAFNNNPNVRVGYHWRNNGNGSGTDPSVAIDDIRITTTVAPVNLISFHALEEKGLVRLDWTSSGEFKLRHYELERAVEPGKFQKVATVAAKGNRSGGNIQYTQRDAINGANILYYRLKMVDEDGSHSYSQVVRVQVGSNVAVDFAGVNFVSSEHAFQMNLWAVQNMSVDITLYDMQSKTLRQMDDFNLLSGENKVKLDASGVAKGTYLVQVSTSKVPAGFQPVKVVKKVVVGA